MGVASWSATKKGTPTVTGDIMKCVRMHKTHFKSIIRAWKIENLKITQIITPNII